jgi:RNA polymerase sigma-70 factor (ECF subfamily)
MPPVEHEAARLYDSFGASLYRYALMILVDREAAEDVIQQVFLAVLGRGTMHVDDVEHYLRRAVRNACYSTLRRRKVRTGDSMGDALLEPIAAHAAGISEEDRLTLATAIRQLPADQREVVHLHVFEGRTFKEVAGVTGDSPNTVASRYRYALEKLQAILTGPGHD